MWPRSSFVGLLALTFVEAVKYGQNHVPTRRDNDLVAANFPDPNTALLSPAFMSAEGVPAAFDNGTEGPTDDATVDYFLQSLTSRNDWMTYRGSELTSEEGRGPSTSLPLDLLAVIISGEWHHLRQAPSLATGSRARKRASWGPMPARSASQHGRESDVDFLTSLKHGHYDPTPLQC